jgi:hypothetical protein
MGPHGKVTNWNNFGTFFPIKLHTFREDIKPVLLTSLALPSGQEAGRKSYNNPYEISLYAGHSSPGREKEHCVPEKVAHFNFFE